MEKQRCGLLAPALTLGDGPCDLGGCGGVDSFLAYVALGLSFYHRNRDENKTPPKII